MSKKKAQTNVVYDAAVGKQMTVTRFKKLGAKEMRLRCITVSEIVARKYLTRAMVDEAIKTGKLKKIVYGNKHYVDRGELSRYLNLAVPTTLF